jgi:hypothetical protein
MRCLEHLGLAVLLGVVVFGCGDQPESDSTGNNSGTGGAPSGGATALGGAVSGGGVAPNGTGATPGSDGTEGGASSTGSVGAAMGGKSGGRGGASAGVGGASPEEIRDATRALCAPFCTLFIESCPQQDYNNCFQGCTVQADLLYERMTCGLEFYESYRCFGELRASDFECSGPGILGCQREQVAYLTCLNGP